MHGKINSMSANTDSHLQNITFHFTKYLIIFSILTIFRISQSNLSY